MLPLAHICGRSNIPHIDPMRTAFQAPSWKPAGARNSRAHVLNCRRHRLSHANPARSPARMTAPSSSKQSSQSAIATSQEVFTWYDQWYPVAYEQDLPVNRPFGFSIWDKPYVIFRDPVTNQYVVLDDICPHRSAPLSEGRLTTRSTHDGQRIAVIECGYHGWQFNCFGKCQYIPQRDPNLEIPLAASLPLAYTTRVSLGELIFVFLGNPDRANEKPLPLPDDFANADEKEITVFRNGVRKFPMSFANILENIADPAHVPFAHHGTGQGDRTKVTTTASMEMVERRPSRYVARNRFTQDRSRYATIYFLPPTCVSYEFKSPLGTVSLMTWTVPESASKCSMFSQMARLNCPPFLRFLTKLRPRWWEHTIMNMILDGDSVLLQHQYAHLNYLKQDSHGGAWKKAYFLGSGSVDTLVVAFRKWLDANANTMPFVTKPSNNSVQRLPWEVVNNRYENHTKHCGSCLPVLRRARVLKVVAIMIMTLAAFVVTCASVCEVVRVGNGAISRKLEIFGMTVVMLAILLLAICQWIIRLMTFTRLSYNLSHRD